MAEGRYLEYTKNSKKQRSRKKLPKYKSSRELNSILSNDEI